MEAQLPLARRTALARRLKHSPSATPRQLDLILDDTRFRGMTAGGAPSRAEGARAAPARGERRGNAGGQR